MNLCAWSRHLKAYWMIWIRDICKCKVLWMKKVLISFRIVSGVSFFAGNREPWTSIEIIHNSRLWNIIFEHQEKHIKIFDECLEMFLVRSLKEKSPVNSKLIAKPRDDLRLHQLNDHVMRVFEDFKYVLLDFWNSYTCGTH